VWLFLLCGVLLSSGSSAATEAQQRRLEDVADPNSAAVQVPESPIKRAAALQISSTPKISPKLRAAIADGAQLLPVFILLRHQPHAEVLQRVEGDGNLEVRIAEDEYQLLAALPFPPRVELDKARERVEAALLDVRQRAFKEIAAEIGPEQDALEHFLLQLGAINIHRYAAMNMLAAEVPGSALAALEAEPSILEVAPIETHFAQLAVSVPALGAASFWNAGYTGAGQSVGVLDTGIKTSHPAFSGRRIVSKVFLEAGQRDTCFADDASTAEDKQGHGTHVAGIVASQGAPGLAAYQGVAKGVDTLYIFKVGYRNCKGSGTSSPSDVLAALDWAAQQAPSLKVINYSYSGDAKEGDDIAARLFDWLADTYGLTFAVAAGNDGKAYFLGLFTREEVVGSPGIAYNVLSVAAMNTNGTADRSDDTVAAFSSRGPTADGRKKPDIAAPGGFRDVWTGAIFGSTYQAEGGIYSADFSSGGFVAMPGTSMAAPHIAGAATLLRASGIQDPLAIRALLLNTTDTLDWARDQGWGYANLARAFPQRSSVLGSSVAFGSCRLFKGVASGLFYSTLTWNRKVLVTADSLSPCLSDLNLRIYDGATNALAASSISSIDNVEKAYAKLTGPVAVKVDHRVSACRSSEPFGLAFSDTGFVAATGPNLSVTCTAAPQVSPGAIFTISCTGGNTGDLTAFGVAGALNWLGGSSGSVQSYDTLAPNASASRSWSATAPTTAGVYTLRADVSSSSFGELFAGSGTVTVVVGSPTPVSPTIALSPASLAFVTDQGSNPPSQNVNVTNTGSGTLAIAASATTTAGGNWLVVSPTSGAAPATFQVSVNSANLAAGTYSGTITVASTSPGVTNSPQVVSVSLIVQAGGIGACCGPEPSLSVTVDAGFYIASSTIQAGGAEGYWEMSVEPQKDQRGGGFIFGGGIQEKGMTPYFAAFLLPSPQEVLIQLNPRLLPGGDASKFSACARLLDGKRQQIGTERCSTGFIEFRQTLPPDFYIIEVRTAGLSPRAYFEFLLGEKNLPAGLIVGGFLSSEVPGFIAFSVAQRQEVRIKAAGRCVFGSFAAKCLQLTLYDSNRNIVAVSGSAGGAASLDLITVAGNGTLAFSGDCGPSTAALPNPADAPTGGNIPVVVGIGGRGSDAARLAIP